MNNSAFVAIRDAFPDFNRRACDERWVLLIPPSATSALSLQFVERHVIVPSPYLKGELVDLAGNSVTIHNGNIESCGRNARILSEETFYGAKGSYKACSISSPIDDSLFSTIPNKQRYDASLFSKDRSVRDWMFVLNTEASIGKSLRYLENETLTIRHRYVLVPNAVGTKDFLRKVSIAVDNCISMIVKENPVKFGLVNENMEMKLVLRRALESYFFTGIHDMVFPQVAKQFIQEESEFTSRAKTFENNNQRDLEGTSALFFRGLNKERSPLSKIEYLKSFLEKDIQTMMNADTILDSFVEILVHIPTGFKADVLANLRYIRAFFCFPLPSALGYLAFQFHAAVSYIYGSDVDILQLDKHRIRERKVENAVVVQAPPPPPVLLEENEEAGDTCDDELNKLGGFLLALKEASADIVSSKKTNTY